MYTCLSGYVSQGILKAFLFPSCTILWSTEKLKTIFSRTHVESMGKAGKRTIGPVLEPLDYASFSTVSVPNYIWYIIDHKVYHSSFLGKWWGKSQEEGRRKRKWTSQCLQISNCLLLRPWPENPQGRWSFTGEEQKPFATRNFYWKDFCSNCSFFFYFQDLSAVE